MPTIDNYNYQQIHDKKLAESICVAAIVRVLSFDSTKMTVNVQPLSRRLQNGSYENQPPILRIPVACTRCGGFITRPWINEGDVGVAVYLDHDMDSVITGGKEATPLTERNHSATDAVFIGAITSGDYVASGLPSDSLALATEDGSVCIAVTKSGVSIKGDVQVDGKITATGDIFTEGKVSGSYYTHIGDSDGKTGQSS